MAYRSARDIIVSTTPRLEGWNVQQYLGTVSSHLVAGTNIFSDIAASLSDVFGGRSKSYRKQLEKINDEVIDQLKEKATDRRANALVGLQIDHDQISGQGKEMFMVTASATAVRADPVEREADLENGQDGGQPLPVQDMEVEVRKEKLLEKRQSGSLSLNSDQWQFLIENSIPDFAGAVRSTAETLAAKPQRALHESDQERLGWCRDYFLSIPRGAAKDHLYPMASGKDWKAIDWAVSVLAEGNMLDLGRIGSMMSGNFYDGKKPALDILSQVDKPYYEEQDLSKLREIRGQIENGFGKRGEVREVEESGMLSSGSKEVWQIEGGPENSTGQKYCQETGLDIYGFKKGETRPSEVAEILGRKIKVLERQFSG